jgi:SAM-dependent methyltransferase
MNFFEELYPWPHRITAVGVHDGTAFRRRYPQVRYVQGDACALPFADGEFDLYFSNAVIEHVGGDERQRAFVREALRVAGRVFVTTPNRWFPLEVHTRLPFVHWLPEPAAHRAYELARKSWAKENRLLGPRELQRLFPVPVRIVNLGMTLVAIA